MDENSSQPNTSAPAQPPKPNFVGQSNIVDRSNLQAELPATAPTGPNVTPTAPAVSNDPNMQASSAFAEAKVLVCGVASATSYILIVYLIKNLWVTAIVSAILAFAAIFFAVSDYRKNSKTSPLTIVGLSAATIALVYIVNALVAQALLRSAASGYTF